MNATATPIDVRRTERGEMRAAAEATATALMSPLPTDETWAERTAGWEVSHSFSGWDGERCVGHACYLDVDTVVPGAVVRSGAVTRVGVLPTHRRRGVATRLMQHLLDDAAERGLGLLSLRATEAVIYGRYGYGIAGHTVDVELVPARARPLATAPATGSMRLLGPDEVLDVVPELYPRVAMRRHGAITRPETWWARMLESAIERKRAGFVAVHLDAAGEPDGYVHYDTEWNDDDVDQARSQGTAGRGTVNDLFGATDEVELELWRYLLDIDLVTRWRAEERPVDDLIRLVVRDPRAVRTMSELDEQWLRLIDVDACLAARSYRPAHRAVTIRVVDEQIPANAGAWTIESAGVTRVDGPHPDADIVAPVGTLGAAYLGGVSWSALVATGRATASDLDAVAAADELFATDRAPYCGTFF